MTGFAREAGVWQQNEWNWELRAVNGKGLDVRLRLPNGFERLEPTARKTCSTMLSRGNIQVSLSIKRGGRGVVPTLNESVFERILQTLEKLEKTGSVAKSSGAEILALSGVMELLEEDTEPEDLTHFDETLLGGLETAVKELAENRAVEGAALAKILLQHIAQIEQLIQKAEDDKTRTPNAISARLKTQLAQLGDAASDLDQERLYQEVALIATKLDIREELDRLNAHTAAARSLIEAGSPVGRKLEFLAQEFNRETNTLCSKSGSVSLTETGLQLKVVVDQFREQILNVE